MIAKRQGWGFVRAGHGSKQSSIKKDQKEPRFNRVYSRDNLQEKIKDRAYVINLEEYSDIETHWIAIYWLINYVTHLDSFGRVNTTKELKKFIKNKNVKTNKFRIQAYDLILCGYFCIGFIDFMLARKTLIKFTNLFLSDNFKKWWYDFKLFYG